MVNRSLFGFLCKLSGSCRKCHPVTKLGYGTIYNAGKYEEVMVGFFTVIFCIIVNMRVVYTVCNNCITRPPSEPSRVYFKPRKKVCVV